MRLIVRGGRALRGLAAVPGDKSIGHRAVLLAGIAQGRSRVRGLSDGDDNRRTVDAMRALGVRVTEGVRTERGSRADAGGASAGATLEIEGVGLEGLRAVAAPGVIDCGNSGTTMRLLAGLLAARGFVTTLAGDASLSARPMGRIAAPLRAMGGVVDGAGGAGAIVPPLRVGGTNRRPRGLTWAAPLASAQVKSALLLCGLRADGPTRVHEPAPTRDHTERMLAAMGAPVEFGPGWAVLDPRGWDGSLRAMDRDVPADLSAAIFPLAAALLAPGSDVEARAVTVQPARAGVLEALAEMGAALGPMSVRDAGGEPVGDLRARWAAPGTLRGGQLAGARTVAAIDEVPVLAAVAALAQGDTVITDAAELRVKETDRIATTAAMLRAFGVSVEERAEGLVIRGGEGGASGGQAGDRATSAARALHPARVDARGDHRIAMAAVVLALAIEGETIIDGAGGVPTSFPGFADAMRALGGDVRAEGGDGP